MIETITLKLNGEFKTCSSQLKLPQFLEQQGLNSRLIAVEYNGEILHRQFWETTEIKSGDVLEIVTIVGGGAGGAGGATVGAGGAGGEEEQGEQGEQGERRSRGSVPLANSQQSTVNRQPSTANRQHPTVIWQ